MDTPLPPLQNSSDADRRRKKRALIFVFLGAFIAIFSGSMAARSRLTKSDTAREPDQPAAASSTAYVAPSSATASTTSPVPRIDSETAQIDTVRANVYFLAKVNALRQEKGLNALALNERLEKSATDWATQMGQTKTLSHTRPENQRVSDWIRDHAYGGASSTVPATARFTENYARAFIKEAELGLEQAIDNALQEMVDEGESGAHYKTIFSPDWKSVGSGFYFDPQGKGSVRAYMVHHYGTVGP